MEPLEMTASPDAIFSPEAVSTSATWATSASVSLTRAFAPARPLRAASAGVSGGAVATGAGAAGARAAALAAAVAFQSISEAGTERSVPSERVSMTTVPCRTGGFFSSMREPPFNTTTSRRGRARPPRRASRFRTERLSLFLPTFAVRLQERGALLVDLAGPEYHAVNEVPVGRPGLRGSRQPWTQLFPILGHHPPAIQGTQNAVDRSLSRQEGQTVAVGFPGPGAGVSLAGREGHQRQDSSRREDGRDRLLVR